MRGARAGLRAVCRSFRSCLSARRLRAARRATPPPGPRRARAGVPLKHVETVDKAKPAIEPGTHIGQNHHKELLQEVTEAAKQRLGAE